MGTYSRLDEGLRRVVARVAVLNLTYFGVEFSVALAIGSVSLFADSIDFLEDTVALHETRKVTTRTGAIGVLGEVFWHDEERLASSLYRNEEGNLLLRSGAG